LSEKVQSEVYLKPENLQRTGSFKVRGALNKVFHLSDEEKCRGTVAASSGNFAIGAAYATHVAGDVPLSLFMAEKTPQSKLDKLRQYDVEIVLTGEDYEEAHEASVAYQQEHDKVYLHTFDDLLVMAGQGTIGVEILEDLPDADMIIIPIGGGGLISGISIAAKAINPQIRIVGAQVSASPSAYLSLKEQRVYEHYKSAPTIAEGLAGGFGMLPYRAAGHLIDEVVLIDEDELFEGIYAMLSKEQLVVEASGIVGVSALMSGKVDVEGKKVVVVLSGGNIDTDLLLRIMNQVRNQTA
jgi:threonine dehydratase